MKISPYRRKTLEDLAERLADAAHTVRCAATALEEYDWSTDGCADYAWARRTALDIDRLLADMDDMFADIDADAPKKEEAA